MSDRRLASLLFLALWLAAGLALGLGSLGLGPLPLALALTAAFGTISVALSAFVERRCTQPLRHLTRRMHALGQGSAPETEEIQTSGIRGELDNLERAFETMEHRLEEQVQTIERLAAIRHELVANVSHDLRTPLSSLQGYLETIVLKHDSLSTEDRQRYLDIALNQSRRLGHLVGELFELTKLDSQMVEPALESFPLTELVQDNVQRFQLRAEERGVALSADFEPGLPPVHADIGMIERVLENLLANAIRFTPAAGRITVALRATDDRLLCEVHDTGQGIPPDALPRIFDRFYRVPHDDTQRREGTGLGLAIAKGILDLHGSDLTVESRVGSGTVFRFDLPTTA